MEQTFDMKVELFRFIRGVKQILITSML